MRSLLAVGFVSIFFVNYAEIKIIPQKKAYYSAGRHLTFLDQKFTLCQETLKAFQLQKKDLKSTMKILGSILSDCRNFQILFIYHIKNEYNRQTVHFMKLTAAQNLFEAYIIYQMLGLEKDEKSKLFARTLELKLMDLLPSFRPKPVKN